MPKVSISVLEEVLTLSRTIDALKSDLAQTRNALMEERTVRQTLERERRALRREKAKSEETLHHMRASLLEKERFAHDMHAALQIPARALINGIRILNEEQIGPLSHALYADLFQVLTDASHQTSLFITQTLTLEQLDLRELIERCILLYAHDILHSKLTIETCFPKRLPLLWGDSLRLRQIIASVLYHSLLFLPMSHGQITIRVKHRRAKEAKAPDSIEITLHNNGLGFTEEQRIEVDPNFGSRSEELPHMMRLSFPLIRKLLHLHYGECTLHPTAERGSVFTLRFPLLEKDILANHPDSFCTSSTSLFDDVFPIESPSPPHAAPAANVIPFPLSR